MSKILRFNGDVKSFASEYQGTERTTFGTTNQSDELTQQQTSAFLRGWGTVGANEDPSLEDFNAAMFTATQYIAYLHQMGVPEWNSLQEYPTDGAQVTHDLRSWLRGPDWVSGDEPGVADSTRWKKVIIEGDLGESSALDVATSAEITAGVTGKVVTDNNLSSSYYRLRDKSVTVAMTTSDKTLTDIENTYGRLVLTGTIGADREIIVSDYERNITVVNNTDDGFQVKVVTSSGTGVHVQNDCSYNLRCDGTDILTLHGCKLDVLPTGSYSVGSFSFPNSLSESAFYYLELTGGGAATDYRNSTIITKDQIGTSGTGFNYTRAYVYTDANIWARIDRIDEFSYSITNSTLFLNSIKGILNEGVTY